MVAISSKTKSRAAGAALVSSQNTSLAHGQSDAAGVKPQISLSDFIQALDDFTPRPRLNANSCPIKRLEVHIPAEAMAKIHAILDNRAIVAKQVEHLFIDWQSLTGVHVGMQSIWKHRRRDCTCPK